MNKSTGNSDTVKIVRAAGIVGGATMFSRVLGLARDAVMAAVFGATPAADAFFVAFRIPNLMRQLFGEGALAASFVPVYTDTLEKRGRQYAAVFSSNLFSSLMVILTAFTVVGVIFAPLLVRIIAHGFAPGTQAFELTVMLTRWMLPYMVFICAAAMGMGILNSHGHFLAPAAAPALLNISIIFAVLVVAPGMQVPVTALAWGVLAGGVLQFLLQVPPLAGRGVMPRLVVPSFSPEIRRILVMMGPAVLGVAVYQVNMLVDTLLASFLPTGSITYLWYGNRLMQFPLGVFGIALATAALPTLSAQIAEGRRGDFTKTVSFSLGMTAFIGFPAALGLIALKMPIIATLFGRGAFSNADVAGSATALLFYSAGLPLFIGIKILGRAFFALENTRTPFAAAGAALAVNIVLNLLLMGPMGHGGLALATSLASAVNFLILAWYFTALTGTGWIGKELVGDVIASAIAAAAMFIATTALAGRVPWFELGTLSRAKWLLCCLGVGVVVYLTFALILGCKSMKTLTKRLFST
ncbi:MAG: murein biosynthesis integral membrane protein MurJ [bacterium]|nr:murein biosynthesis integral membrane protein MurJ [bacterium]